MIDEELYKTRAKELLAREMSRQTQLNLFGDHITESSSFLCRIINELENNRSLTDAWNNVADDIEDAIDLMNLLCEDLREYNQFYVDLLADYSKS